MLVYTYEVSHIKPGKDKKPLGKFAITMEDESNIRNTLQVAVRIFLKENKIKTSTKELYIFIVSKKVDGIEQIKKKE